MNSIINVINDWQSSGFPDIKVNEGCMYLWTLYVVPCSCPNFWSVYLLCWLVEWAFWITFALHNNSFRPYDKRAWGRACEPSALEKMLGVNFWILFYVIIFNLQEQLIKNKLRHPHQTSGGFNDLMNSLIIKTQVRSKTLSSVARPQDLERGSKLAWNKEGETGCLFSRTLWCAALEEKHSVGLMVMTVAC